MKKWPFVVLLLVGATILGGTVLREPIGYAASPFQNVIIGNADNDPVPVNQQGTANVDVTNTPLPVSDGGGSLTVDGSVGIAGTANVNVANASVPVRQSGSWNVGIEGVPTVRPGFPTDPFWESARLRNASSSRVVARITDLIGVTAIT